MNITKKEILSFTKIKNKSEFDRIALRVFQFQYLHNAVYRDWIDLLNIKIESIKRVEDIPHIPISFFKEHQIKTGSFEAKEVFTSSGTTGQTPSKHFVKDLSIYEHSFLEGFKMSFGEIENYHILALLPSYLERDGSSLIYMTQKLIEKSNSPLSGFFLNQYDELFSRLEKAEQMTQKKVLLLGVTYALLDFAESFPNQWDNLIVMETGGMKGRRKEMLKEEFYPLLKKGLGVNKIASEYGMTELLSQAYSFNDGIYSTPPWMKVSISAIDDPKSLLPLHKTGKIQVIDLMNIHSCSFISTDDLGKKTSDKQFKILGRMDHTESRGCNLMLF